MRTAILLVLTELSVFASLGTVARIGKDRKPVTPTEAVISLILNTAFIAGIWYAHS